MLSFKNILSRLADSWIVNLIIATVCLVSGLNEILVDIEDLTLHTGHGLVAVGVWHVISGLSDALESLDYASKATSKSGS